MRICSVIGLAVATASFLSTSGTASAHVPPPSMAFNVGAVSDFELESMRGGYVREGQGRPMIDAQARSDFRMSADVGTITFDNWFVDVGAAMIINARLAAPR